MWLLDDREKIVEEKTGSWISDVAAAEGTDRLDTDALHDERLARARTIMEAEGLRGLLCLDPTNIRYLTGQTRDPWQEFGKTNFGHCALLTLNDDPIILELTPESPLKVPLGTIGIDRPGTDLARLAGNLAKLSKTDITNAHPIMLKARATKDMEELEHLRFVTDIADIAFQRVRSELLQPGVSEREIAAKCQEFLITSGFESVENLMCASGANTLKPEPFPTERLIREGDLVILGILGTGPGGYRVRVQRTFKCGIEGNVVNRENDLYRRCHQAMRLVMANCWPGQKAGSLLDALCDFPELPAPVGHAIGLDWHEGFEIGPDITSSEILEAHTYLTLRVHIQEEGIAIGLEENFIVTPEGPVYFTCFPLEKDLL